MFAIIAQGSKQYMVHKGDSVVLDRLHAEPGDKVKLPLVLAGKKGKVLTEGEVKATVVSHFRGTKIRVFKKKRRKQYRRTKGYRSELTTVVINTISAK